jgi:hypothetical protein
MTQSSPSKKPPTTLGGLSDMLNRTILKTEERSE